MSLSSKPNTLYKLIRFLEHVPDGRRIPGETYAQAIVVRDEK